MSTPRVYCLLQVLLGITPMAGYPLKVGQSAHDCRYSKTPGTPATGGPRLEMPETVVASGVPP